MGYIKQNFVDNETVLKAEHLNHIEDGIENINNSIKASGDNGFSLLTGTTIGKNYVRKNNITGECILHLYATGLDTAYTSMNVAFAQLPEGYRPSSAVNVWGIGYDGSSYAPTVFIITPSGDICQQHATAKTYTRVSLDAIYFTDFNNYTN